MLKIGAYAEYAIFAILRLVLGLLFRERVSIVAKRFQTKNVNKKNTDFTLNAQTNLMTEEKEEPWGL